MQRLTERAGPETGMELLEERRGSGEQRRREGSAAEPAEGIGGAEHADKHAGRGEVRLQPAIRGRAAR
ncbi:MAG: hypothetical protein AUH78_27205 [Gemmatimonadetes bacterium 13_1_40CM_4_69_8]|nr:MAG: hypothetical protein AUH78_27205 [Gemmatimonadetes bacterium 13_1_40CM_4_69_8]